MRIRRECHRVRAQIEAWEQTMPEWVQAHLRECIACTEQERREQGYRRAVQAVRREPVPACSLRWEQVQAQLAARAVRQRTLRWRFALAGGFASVAALIALGSLWLIYSSKSSSPLLQGVPPKVVASAPTPSLGAPNREVLFKTPAEPKREGEAPATPKLKGKAPAETRSFASFGMTDHQPNGEVYAAPKLEGWAYAQPKVETLNFRGERNNSFGVSEMGSTVALLPLPDLRPETGANTDYLPIQYGGLEESHVYSF